MKGILKRIRFSKAEKIALVTLICLLLGFWLASGHIWLSVNSHSVSIDSRSLSEGSDYSNFRSLNEDVFCYHQDHGAQYLISPKRNEVSVISESEEVTIFPDFILLSNRALASLEDANKKRLPDAKLVIGNGYIEFVGIHNERWHISN